MTEVRSPHRKLIPDIVDQGKHEPTFLRGIANKARMRPDYRFRDLSRCLDKPFLKYCFWKLNRKSAPGVDKVTVIEYGKSLDKNLDDLRSRLKNESYKAKLVRRKHIPKAPGKTRPLGIPAIEDKLVQTAVSEILSAIYEQYVYNGLGEKLFNPLDSVKGLGIIGSEEFIDNIRAKYLEKIKPGSQREQPHLREIKKKFQPEELIEAFCKKEIQN